MSVCPYGTTPALWSVSVIDNQADWFVWLASTLGRFFDERSGKAEHNVTNIFDKPNEQNEALFNYAMARKRRMKSNSDVPTMKSTTLQDGRYDGRIQKFQQGISR